MDARITLGNLDPKNPPHKAAIDAMMAATIEFMRFNHGVVVPGITATIPELAKWGAQLVSEPGRLVIELPRIDREANPISTSGEDLFLAEGAAIPDSQLDLRLAGILEPWPIKYVAIYDMVPGGSPTRLGYYQPSLGGCKATVTNDDMQFSRMAIAVEGPDIEFALDLYRKVRDGLVTPNDDDYPTVRDLLAQALPNGEVVIVDMVGQCLGLSQTRYGALASQYQAAMSGRVTAAFAEKVVKVITGTMC